MYRSINVDFMYERNKIENCVENIKMKNRTFQSKSQVSIPASHSDCNRDINFRNKLMMNEFIVPNYHLH